MHPTLAYEITKARIADEQRQAHRNAIASAADRAHRTRTIWRPRLAAARAHRVVILAAAHGRAARSRPPAVCSPSAPCTGCI